MLISAQYLVDRLRHPRSRADEVAALRRRLESAPGHDSVSEEERSLALEMRRLREELSGAFTVVESCGGCAQGHPLPHGRWQGGHCCGCRTEQVFTDEEVASLKLSGTTPGKLVPPVSDHAGCSFRGPEGCSLPPAHRPSLCVRFVCRELEQELRERGELQRIRAIANALAKAAERFKRAREERLGRETDEDEPTDT